MDEMEQIAFGKETLAIATAAIESAAARLKRIVCAGTRSAG